jgi:2-polyprenyl-3-methyl-5-hydroxy-6-metoxy-1,4-benzoquinol methylase
VKRLSHAGKLQSNAGSEEVRRAILRSLDRRIMGQGALALPCVPALLDAYVEKLVRMWREMGRLVSEGETVTLRRKLGEALRDGFETSPNALLVVTYQVNPVPESNLGYSVSVQPRDVAEYYDDWAEKAGEGALFGAHADAKVLELAHSILATHGSQPAVLDVGAGDGRNALPLGKLGCAVDALEPSAKLRERLASAAQASGVNVRILASDLLADDLVLDPAAYALVIASEIFTHLRDATQLGSALARLAPALQPGGMLVFNAFVARDGYNPSSLLLQAAQAALSSVFTRSEIADAVRAHGLTLVSEESARDYEKSHLPATAWPPTPWFESWASGRNILDLEASQVPVTLRWLTLQRA